MYVHVYVYAAASVSFDEAMVSVDENDGVVSVEYTLDFVAGSEIDLQIPLALNATTGKITL